MTDFVREYLDGYEFRFDGGGGHQPEDHEKAMLEDFGNGLLTEYLERKTPNDTVQVVGAEGKPSDKAMVIAGMVLLGDKLTDDWSVRAERVARYINAALSTPAGEGK